MIKDWASGLVETEAFRVCSKAQADAWFAACDTALA